MVEVLGFQFGKDYARTTVVTFLMKIENKGFISTYRVGKLSCAHAEKSAEETEKIRGIPAATEG